MCASVVKEVQRERVVICYDNALQYSSLLTRTTVRQNLNNLIQLLISRQYSLKTPWAWVMGIAKCSFRRDFTRWVYWYC